MSSRIYILSPARCDGVRARLLLNPRSTFDLAVVLRQPAGATVGEVFSFLSGLYFRGKTMYARRYATPPKEHTHRGAMVITTNRGLLPLETVITLADLRGMAQGKIDADDAAFRDPLLRDIQLVSNAIGPAGQAVLLGSIASDKYASLLLSVLGERLMFPSAFVGRGDLSRGGLMLRSVRSGEPLDYVQLVGAMRRGRRPPRLSPEPDRVTAMAGRAPGRRRP